MQVLLQVLGYLLIFCNQLLKIGICYSGRIKHRLLELDPKLPLKPRSTCLYTPLPAVVSFNCEPVTSL